VAQANKLEKAISREKVTPEHHLPKPRVTGSNPVGGSEENAWKIERSMDLY
jgi:hypothetical protein